MKTSTCQECNTAFTVKPGSYGKFCSLSCGMVSRNRTSTLRKINKYNLAPTLCAHCQKPLPFNKRKNKFCSHSCSATTNNFLPRKRGPIPKVKLASTPVKFLLCKHTNLWYCNKGFGGIIQKCSPYIKTLKEKYYAAARFKFNVFHYPTEFDLPLLQTYNWYSCPGKKRKHDIKNVDGVSRDHLISVSYGFANNIDPKIISHPANCALILHKENKKKHSKCAISLPELLLRIAAWDQKYSERRVGLEPTTSDLEGQCSTI